ncbi:sensor histidine kinase [Streptomyces sp. CA-132043]|uniref:sensor histidine kinase n=1 Tax=Streptomyces sp. CA-132043 TaxID=3240048 RepID=UPI003D929178
MKFSTRIALAVGVVVPVLVLTSGWLLYLLVAHDLHVEQDNHLRDRADAVTRQARQLLRVTAKGRPAAAQQRERQMYTAALDVGIRVRGPFGTVSGGPQPDTRTQLPETEGRPVTVHERTTERGEGGARSWRVLSREVDGSRPGVRGTVWLVMPDTAHQARLASVRRRVVAVAVLGAPVSALLAWATASRASRPLRRLQQRAGGLDPRGGTSRLDHVPTGVREVDDLAGTLQTLLTRYDEQVAHTTQALDTARSFSSAAGHELRTPLMSMRTNLDILAEHPDLDLADRVEVVDELREEHARLLSLLVMLRELGKGDLVEADALGPVDLSEVAEAAVADARRRDRTASITLSAPLSGVTVTGWEPGIRTCLDNLLVNALTHGRNRVDGKSRITVSVQADEAHTVGRPVVLVVDDDGPGIPAELRETVFRRFHRDPGSTGSGLGLTLVAQQAALHGATAWVEDAPGGHGTRFALRFPSSHSAASQAALPVRRDWLSGATGVTAAPAHPQRNHKDGP